MTGNNEIITRCNHKNYHLTKLHGKCVKWKEGRREGKKEEREGRREGETEKEDRQVG